MEKGDLTLIAWTRHIKNVYPTETDKGEEPEEGENHDLPKESQPDANRFYSKTFVKKNFA